MGLKTLREQGAGAFDVPGVLKTWNAQTSRANQIVGVKSMAVRNLMEMPQDNMISVRKQTDNRQRYKQYVLATLIGLLEAHLGPCLRPWVGSLRVL